MRRTRNLLVSSAMVVLAAAGAATACGRDRPPLTDTSGTTRVPGIGGGTGLLTGPCDEEGASVTCDVETGRHEGVVNCFRGTQVCHGGQWGSCAGSGGLLSSKSLALIGSPSGGGLSTLAVTSADASTTAAGCANNPCNPYCLGIDTDAGALQQDGGFITTTSIVANSSTFSMFPSPAKTKGNVSPCSTTVSSANNATCSYDYCCDPTGTDAGAGLGACVPWPSSTACGKCTGVDYTLGVGCVDSAMNTRVPVCNHGTADSPTTGTLYVQGSSGNVPAAGTSAICAEPSPANDTCTINLAMHPIAAGKCIDLNFTNPPAGITCTGFPGNRTLAVNLAAGHVLSECDNCNNYSFNYTSSGTCAIYGVQPPAPSGSTYRYTARCPTGTHVRWNQFAYNTAVPNASDVLFRVHTAPLVDGGIGTFTVLVDLAHPATPLIADPAICLMSGGVTGCPKDLYAKLGGVPATSNEVLELDLTLTATTQIPTVYSWQLTYDCAPAE